MSRVRSMRPAPRGWCLTSVAALLWMSGGGPRPDAQSAAAGAEPRTSTVAAAASRAATGQGAAAPAIHLLIVAGAGGEPAYTRAFGASASALAEAATSRHGVPEASIVCLVEDSARAPRVCATRSTRAEVERAAAAIAARARAGDRVVIVLIGHGSGEGTASRFNLPGPDLTAAEWSRLIGRLSGQRVAFVNTASASGDFVPALAAPGRVIVAATKTAFERNETMFGRFFVAAYTGDGADVDKDGRVSLLEAFDFARREVARAYEGESRIQTEHAVLDDDGDGKGATAPDGRGDGALARAFWLGGAGGNVARAGGDPRALALASRKDSIEARLDALRARKAAMDSTAYTRELERLLVALATTNRELRAVSGGKP